MKKSRNNNNNNKKKKKIQKGISRESDDFVEDSKKIPNVDKIDIFVIRYVRFQFVHRVECNVNGYSKQ